VAGRPPAARRLTIQPVASSDFSPLSAEDFPIEPPPDRSTNVLDLETAIELFTPVYQPFLTDSDFWPATNSLQLDETIGIYVANPRGPGAACAGEQQAPAGAAVHAARRVQAGVARRGLRAPAYLPGAREARRCWARARRTTPHSSALATRRGQLNIGSLVLQQDSEDSAITTI